MPSLEGGHQLSAFGILTPASGLSFPKERVLPEEIRIDRVLGSSFVCRHDCTPWTIKVFTRLASHGVHLDSRTSNWGLHVCFGAESDSIPFLPSELQDIAVSSYAMRPFYCVPVADMMPMEMQYRDTNDLNHYTGTGLHATRNTSTILCKLGASEIDMSLSLFRF
jgi:hypothetical protein